MSTPKSGDTVTVELELSDINREGTECAVLTASGRAKLITTLAAHDAAANPLGLPWDANPCADLEGDEFWDVYCSIGRLTGDLTQAQARLMAAAPELADALEDWVQYAEDSGHGKASLDDAHAALKKAGRR